MMKEMLGNSYLFGSNAPFIEALYEAYLKDPAVGRAALARLFRRAAAARRRHGRRLALRRPGALRRARAGAARRRRRRWSINRPQLGEKQFGVLQLIAAYRILGVRHADIDPLERQEKPNIPELDPAFYGLTEADMDTVFNTGTLVGPREMKLREILQFLQGHLLPHHRRRVHVHHRHGAEALGAGAPGERARDARVRRRVPEAHPRAPDRRRDARALSAHASTSGRSASRCEGGETLIPQLDHLLQRAGKAGVQELVIGMAHRGRLNVLVNTHGQDAQGPVRRVRRQARRRLCSPATSSTTTGFSSNIMTPGGPMHVTLAFNPVAPGDRQSGGRRLGARAPAPAPRLHRRPGAAGADPRRRRRSRGRAWYMETLESGADARLRHRRHRAHHHQQPDRLHHAPTCATRARRSTAPTSRRCWKCRSST